MEDHLDRGLARRHLQRRGAGCARDRRSASGVLVRSHRPADAVPDLRANRLGRRTRPADFVVLARRRSEREHLSRHCRRLTAKARRRARLHRRLAARLCASWRLRQSVAITRGLRRIGDGGRAACRRHAAAAARARPERARGHHGARAGDRDLRRRSSADVSRRAFDGQRRRLASRRAVPGALARRRADVRAVHR